VPARSYTLAEVSPAPERVRRDAAAAVLVSILLLIVGVALIGAAGPADASTRAAQDAPDGGAGVRGVLRVGNTPVEGVLVDVSIDGESVGEATTDAAGEWAVPVPGPGTYQVTIDTDTLPEGTELRDPDRTSVDARVREGQDRAVLIPLAGEGGTGSARPGSTGPTLAERIAQASFNGVRFGLIIAMAAIGLSLIFGTTGLVNFAHSEFVTFGAVATWYLNTRGPELHLVAAAAIAVLVTALVGGALDRGVWRPLRSRQVGLFQMLVITIGISLAARHLILLFFGGRSRPFLQYTIQETLSFGPFTVTPRDLVVMVLSIVALVVVATMLQRTRIGKAMRAVADNDDLAESSGIDVQRVILFVWIVGAGLAAVGGVFLGSTETVSWLMGFRLLLLMFAGVILGGLGTAYGAMIGGLVVGLVTEVSTVWFSSELKNAWGLLVLIIVLLVRPQGILGTRERIG